MASTGQSYYQPAVPHSTPASTCNTIADVCLIVELVYLMMWVLPLMFSHKVLFQVFKLEQHSLADVLLAKDTVEQHGLADALLTKDTVPVTTKMLRSSWTQNGQLQLLFVIVACAVTWTGHLKIALLMTLIFQTGNTIFLVKDQLLNPYGLDDELRFVKNPRLAIVVAINIVLAGVQYYGWTMAQCDELGLV